MNNQTTEKIPLDCTSRDCYYATGKLYKVYFRNRAFVSSWNIVAEYENNYICLPNIYETIIVSKNDIRYNLDGIKKELTSDITKTFYFLDLNLANNAAKLIDANYDNWDRERTIAELNKYKKKKEDTITSLKEDIDKIDIELKRLEEEKERNNMYDKNNP